MVMLPAPPTMPITRWAPRFPASGRALGTVPKSWAQAVQRGGCALRGITTVARPMCRRRRCAPHQGRAMRHTRLGLGTRESWRWWGRSEVGGNALYGSWLPQRFLARTSGRAPCRRPSWSCATAGRRRRSYSAQRLMPKLVGSRITWNGFGGPRASRPCAESWLQRLAWSSSSAGLASSWAIPTSGRERGSISSGLACLGAGRMVQEEYGLVAS
mmetsp:Transcript_55588/g.119605  ORF Transcript_55588/g.119605 Transcript_55588/m.119605 type:complete len:214 (-) Transcript_55588:659-1300(-)